MVLCVAQLASAQTGVRIFGAQQFVLDDNTFANPKVYLSANNGSMGIDQNGFVTGTFPNATSMLTILAGTKTFGLKIDGGSTWGIDIVNTNNGIRSAGRNFFGDGAGIDDNVFNIGGGNMFINTLPTPALPGPLTNVVYMSGGTFNQMTMTPGGINIVTGSGTLNTIPLWTPTGFQLGNSVITQPTTSTVVVTPAAGGTNVFTINNGSNASTALKINANGGTGINIDPAGTGIQLDATTTGINYVNSNPTTGINLRATTTGINFANSPTTGINVSALTTGINFPTIPSTAAIDMFTGFPGASSIGIRIINSGGIMGNGINVASSGGTNTAFIRVATTNAATTTHGILVENQGNVGTTWTNGVSILANNGATTTTGLNISATGGGMTTALSITNTGGTLTNAVSITGGNVILGSTLNTIASGGTIPNGQAIVDVNNNGVAASVATVTLPAGATNGQVCYITTEDPDGVKITVGLSSVTISNAEVGRFMFINGTWRLEH